MKKVVYFLMIVAMLFAGCGETGTEKEVTPVSTVDTKAIVEARNGFTFSLLSRIYGDDFYQNTAISGLSAHLAMCMVANGAVGSSKDEILSALGAYMQDMKQINEANSVFLNKAYADDISLVSSNSIWVDQETRTVTGFTDTMADFYKAVFQKIDFGGEDSAKTVNGWVDKNTGGKIKEMVTQDEVKDAMMLILNAIYLKAPWTNQFEEAATSDEDFILLNGKPSKVRMMSREGFYKYHKGDGFQIARIPYGQKEDLAAYVVLPESLDGLINLSKMFTEKELSIEIAKLQEKMLVLKMPKFKFEFEANLIPTLKELGMNAVFDASTSDLSEMIQPPPEAFISLIKHKTFMDVHEGGTEAAAVTAVEMVAGAAPGEDAGPPVFLVDHPFMFIIRDEQTGDIVFASCVVQP